MHGGSMLLYMREDTPSLLLNSDVSLKGFIVELSQTKEKETAIILFL